MAAGHDFADDGTAWVHRQIKARHLEGWCWDHGITARRLATADGIQLRGIARLAGVNPPRSGRSQTWLQVAARLEARQVWADQHPQDPRSVPCLTDVDTCVCDPLGCALNPGDCTACPWCVSGWTPPLPAWPARGWRSAPTTSSWGTNGTGRPSTGTP
jgi:hypothetical protein